MTRGQASKLRGLVQTYVAAVRDYAEAYAQGRHDVIQSGALDENMQDARDKYLAYVRELTEAKK